MAMLAENRPWRYGQIVLVDRMRVTQADPAVGFTPELTEQLRLYFGRPDGTLQFGEYTYRQTGTDDEAGLLIFERDQP